jgi:hypothetical protein
VELPPWLDVLGCAEELLDELVVVLVVELVLAEAALTEVDLVERVVLTVLLLPHTRPLGCSASILLITPSIFEPAPTYPGG